MVKLGLLLPLLFGVAFASNPIKSETTPNYKDYLITEANERGNNTVTGIINQYKGNSNIRIYSWSDLVIDEIADTAFSGTTFSSIMISNAVTHINDAVFQNASNITTVMYTGSLEEFAELNISTDITVREYAYDEGFINYWNKEIRPTENTNICNITQQTFSYVYGLYKNLLGADKLTVDDYTDKGGAKIKDSMNELISIFQESSPSQKNDEWNQTGAITFIIIIALIGMTSITVFFLLKTKKIID